MRGKLTIRRGAVLVTIFYLFAYAALRLSGGLMHFENRADPDRGHEVRIPSDGFTAIEESMAEEAGVWWWRIRSKGWHGVEGIFWPLRKVESLAWNLID